jgi:hypothetical protein
MVAGMAGSYVVSRARDDFGETIAATAKGDTARRPAAT